MKQITSKFNDYFKEQKLQLSDQEVLLTIDETVTYQTHMGYGGAFTDAACSIFNQLDETQKKEVLKAYFSKEGLNYNLGRLTIGSCDFSRFSYDYINDYNGDDFALKHDKEFILDFVNRAKKENDNIRFMASPWSPPKMYKTTKEKCHGGFLNKDCYDLYAKYLTNYVEHMKKEEIEISFLTVQNEPAAVQPWESCVFTPQEEFLLAKKIYKELQFRSLSTKLFLWDHNRDAIVERAIGYYEDKDADEIIYGFAYHWYDEGCSYNLSKVHEMHPDKHLIFSEGCIELLNLNRDDPKSAIGSMQNALRYAKNYILDSLNYTEGFIDWNLLLDEKGGPNHVGNYCESLIMFDREKHQLIYNPSYYVVKHFAHYIEQGAKRIKVENKTNVLATAYLNKDGKIIVVLSNENEDTSFTMQIKGQKVLVKLPMNSITTIVC